MIQRFLCFIGFHRYGAVVTMKGMSRKHYGKQVCFRRCPECEEVYEDG